MELVLHMRARSTSRYTYVASSIESAADRLQVLAGFDYEQLVLGAC